MVYASGFDARARRVSPTLGLSATCIWSFHSQPKHERSTALAQPTQASWAKCPFSLGKSISILSARWKDECLISQQPARFCCARYTWPTTQPLVGLLSCLVAELEQTRTWDSRTLLPGRQRRHAYHPPKDEQRPQQSGFDPEASLRR